MKYELNYSKIKNDKNLNSYRCIHCGHTVFIHPTKNTQLCRFCGKYVERKEKYNIEFITLKSFLERRYYNFKKGIKI